MKKMKSITVPSTQARTSAQASLTGCELRLFLYMCDMAIVVDGELFPLDRLAIANNYGMGLASYTRALKGLREKGYVKKQNARTYLFDALGRFRD